MKQKLFLFLCIISVTNAVAQVRNTPLATNKNTEKETAPKIDYKQAGAPMPRLLLLAASDSADMQQKDFKRLLTNEDLENKANLLVMMFNPTCSHCQNETMILEQNISLFKKSMLVMVANKGMTSYLPNFIKQYKIADYPLIHIGIDSTNFIDNAYLYSALPQINIYNKHRKLLKIYKGDIPIDSLKQYIQ